MNYDRVLGFGQDFYDLQQSVRIWTGLMWIMSECKDMDRIRMNYDRRI